MFAARFGILIWCATIFLILQVSSAFAGVETVTAAGRIEHGSDSLGLFGPAGGSLDNGKYLLTIGFDTSQPGFTSSFTPNVGIVSGGPISITATVNGKSFSF